MRRAMLRSVSLRKVRVFASFVVFVLLAAMMLTPFGGIIASVAAASIERSVIVTLKDEPAAVWKARQQKAGRQVTDADLQAYRDSLTAKQDTFLNALAAKGIDATVDGVDVTDFAGESAGRIDFRFNLVLNAVTLKVPNSQLSALASMPQVKAVKPNKQLRLHLNKSVPYVNAPPVYGQFAEINAADNFREGYEGQGVNVAVLDTGIDWKHEMFGGDPTPPRFGLAPQVAAVNTNQKVIYYLPLTAGAAIDGYGHGTAAASDIGGYLGIAPGQDKIPGTADDIRVHGVAPQARLMGYKVCVDVGSCLNASTIMGIEDAVSPVTKTLQPKPVAHVINMSLGGAGTPDDDTAIAGDNAALLGTIVVASAGNSGPGQGTIGSPSAGRHVISVAASSDPGSASETWTADLLQANAVPAAAVGAVTPADNLPANDDFARMRLYKMADTPNPAARAIAQRYVMIDLFPAPGPYPAAATGRIALIKDSGLASATFMDICNSAAANGAIAALYISSTLNPGAIHGLIPCAVVDPDTGNSLIDAMSSTDDNVTDPPNGTVSELPIRINPYKDNMFYGDTTSFSSRGPVAGLGQVKPDVTAPGLAVLSATVRVGSADANTGTMFDPTGYTPATGTSFSGPHVAGATALIKQAHLDWTPDVVRTALINTATNLRSEAGAPKADGGANDSIIDQGGGLIDVAGAIRTKAIMGVEADGITLPGILGSHSFGEKAVLNNRITNTFSVPVVIRDVSGEGGTYTLSTANNRSTDQPGVTTGTSSATISVPAGGTATFNATISIDGNVLRSTSIEQMQWYVVATSSSGKKLRMPMFLQAIGSVPGDGISLSETTQYTGTVPVGDGGAQRDRLGFVTDVNYVDIPVDVPANTAKLDGLLKFTVVQDVPGLTGLPDLDFMLYDPNGDQIGQSAGSTDTERITVNTTIPGQYVWRVYGFIAAATSFTLDSTQLKGGGAPVVQPFESNFTQDGTRYDFDGNLTLTWNPQGAVEAFEIEHSTDGTNWETLGQVSGTTTSQAIAATDGVHSYRIRSIVPGKVGKYVTQPSNVESITVSRRVEVDATDRIEQINRSISFPAGSTEIVAALKNISTTTLYPNVRLEIVGVSSAGNSVRVSNADNGGNGVTSVAAFDYSQLVGADFITGEESGNKTLRFSNPNNQLFTITVRVIANVATGTGGGSTSGGSTAGATSGGTTGDGTAPAGTNSGTLKVLTFTVNPLTKTVSLLK